MKIKQIATAVSAVLLSSSAFALTPTTVPDIEIFMSGASAQDKAIGMLFENLCTNIDAAGNPVVDPATGARIPTDLDIYKDNVNIKKPGKAHTAYFCTIDNGQAGFPATDTTVRKVLFHKRSKGGSGEGVNPVINELAIDAMNINNNNCTKATGESFYRCDITTLDPTTGFPIGLYKKVSDAGVSDVNPEMFVGANVPTGNAPVSITDISNKMVVKSAAAAVFGIPVTTSLRDALQEAGIAAGELAATCVGSDTEACMPNLNKRQVASLATGKIGDWSAFMVKVKSTDVNGNIVYTGTPLTSVASIVPVDTMVTFCRRVNGSGTQAQMSANFLHYPCTSNASAPMSAPGNVFGGPNVVENEGSGDMSACLNAFNNGIVGSVQNPSGTKAWAFGLQSTEKNGDLKDDYRFVKIDGVAPTIQNAANGKYLDWAEQTFQWRKPTYNGPTGDKLTVIETIARTASNPTTIGTLDKKLVQPWGQGGYLAVSTNFAPSANGILDITAPVIPYSHAASGKLDNCTVPLLNDAYQNLQL